jgi:hypothetical protein
MVANIVAATGPPQVGQAGHEARALRRGAALAQLRAQEGGRGAEACQAGRERDGRSRGRAEVGRRLEAAGRDLQYSSV